MNEGDIVVVWAAIKRGKQPGYNITLFQNEEEAYKFYEVLMNMKQKHDATICRVINWNGRGKLNDMLEDHDRKTFSTN